MKRLLKLLENAVYIALFVVLYLFLAIASPFGYDPFKDEIYYE
ncbi:MAG: hypothetical protein U0X91_20870 [Spirosomataceae bacterium]